MTFIHKTYKTLASWLGRSAAVYAVGAICVLSACSDDFGQERGGQGEIPTEVPENCLAVPLFINTGEEISSRAVSDEDFSYGTDEDHKIDFENDHECFAIFFNSNDRFMSLKRLYSYETLGVGSMPSSKKDENGVPVEYMVPVVAYVPFDSLPSKVLVVLNGGRIYDKLVNEFFHDVRDSEGKVTKQPDNTKSADDFLGFKWESSYSSDGVIGINNEGHFTMTNSAYYNAAGTQLMTVTTLNRDMFQTALTSNLTPEKSAAIIYVERMVAKYSTPSFSSEVIGSDRFFRPSQNALSMILYSWNADNELVSEHKNWRIHVLGWTVNNRETSNYLFKNIRVAKEQGLKDWGISEWNDYGRRRSYWSVDPHYNNREDYYPWQYRKAVDNIGISYEWGMNEKKTFPTRHINFEYLSRNWSELPLTISENTYDPTLYPAYDNNSYDGRAQVIVGPHLLVGAEIYLEFPNMAESENSYIGRFRKVQNLYSDRLRRFYLREVDWFKMFIRDFNNALETQEKMKFTFYEWGKDANKTPVQKTYQVIPTGSCRLYYVPQTYNKTTQKYEDKVFEESDPEYEFAGKELTADLLDRMIKAGIIPLEHEAAGVTDDIPWEPEYRLSVDATLKNGDGRRIPWIDGIVIRSSEKDGEGKNIRLPVYEYRADEDYTGQTPLEWNDDMRKSLFCDWFGPVDHYFRGYMYYSSPILHHRPNGSNVNYYGSVRNHWYKFTVTSINALGVPVDNISQPIIPESYNYQGMISVYLDILDWHSMRSEFNFN